MSPDASPTAFPVIKESSAVKYFTPPVVVPIAVFLILVAFVFYQQIS
jgi:hypothetical protein